MPPVCFFFSIEALVAIGQAYYSYPAQEAVLRAATHVAPGASYVMRVGDALVDPLVEKTVEVMRDASRDRPGVRFGPSVTTARDRDAVTTVIWDFCDSVSEGWHTLDLATTPAQLGGLEIFAVALSSLSADAAAGINDALATTESYLGAFGVDLGNPVQAGIVAFLPEKAMYRAGELVFDPGTPIARWIQALLIGKANGGPTFLAFGLAISARKSSDTSSSPITGSLSRCPTEANSRPAC